MTTRSMTAGAMLAVALVALPLAARAADPVFPLASHVGLVAPGAMKPSSNFRGFEDHEAGASILILEIPPQAYADIEKQMTADALKKQGMTEEKRENVTLKSGKGVLIVGEQTADNKKMRKWILLASTPELSTLVAVQIPNEAKAKYPDAGVRTALMSTAIRTAVPLDEQLKLLPITVGDPPALRPFRTVSGTTVFLTDGAKDPADVTTQPLFIISIGNGGPEEASARANFSRTMFSSLNDFKDVRIVGTDVIRADSLQTYEIQAEAKDAKTDAPVNLVQWVRFGHGAFIRFVGIARSDTWKDAFPKFRAVRDATKPRG
jgi:hypothetical protein